jgi:Na+-transporting methylmalonyl-CoA/oxaloacetate decarboxylase beta subunit
LQDIVALLKELFSGVLFMGTVDGLKTLVMFVISGILIYLAIKKDYEPALLLPIAFGSIMANLPPIIDAVTGDPAASVLGSGGFLTVLFDAALKTNCSRSSSSLP